MSNRLPEGEPAIERDEGIVQLGSIALMIGGHFRDGVWFLEHPKAPAPIPCESIAHMVEKYLKIIEHFGAVQSEAEPIEKLLDRLQTASSCYACRPCIEQANATREEILTLYQRLQSESLIEVQDPVTGNSIPVSAKTVVTVLQEEVFTLRKYRDDHRRDVEAFQSKFDAQAEEIRRKDEALEMFRDSEKRDREEIRKLREERLTEADAEGLRWCLEASGGRYFNGPAYITLHAKLRLRATQKGES